MAYKGKKNKKLCSQIGRLEDPCGGLGSAVQAP